jgi:hypothetical protein
MSQTCRLNQELHSRLSKERKFGARTSERSQTEVPNHSSGTPLLNTSPAHLFLQVFRYNLKRLSLETQGTL